MHCQTIKYKILYWAGWFGGIFGHGMQAERRQRETLKLVPCRLEVIKKKKDTVLVIGTNKLNNGRQSKFQEWISTYVGVNKWCHSHRWLQSSIGSWWALKKHRAEKNTCHLAAIRQQPLPMLSPEKTQDGKIQDIGTRLLRYISKESFQWAWILASFRTQKSSKFLNLAYLVSLINSNILMLPTTCPLVQNSYIF